MQNHLAVSTFDLILCLSQAIDLVSPAVADHHKRVAYIALQIATELGLSIAERKRLAIAGAVHDVGGLSLRDRLDALEFELEHPHEHSKIGYCLLNTFRPLADVADLVRFHHVPWHHGAGMGFKGHAVSSGSHLLHLADRISVLVDPQEYILAQVERITARIVEQSGEMFVPEWVDAFRAVASREYFWLDIVSPTLDVELKNSIEGDRIELASQDCTDLANLFRRIIDFKSQFTAVHSSGVSACATALAALADFDSMDYCLMSMAGNLHDLGKLAVPLEILDKPDRLTKNEFDVIRRHAYYTNRILEPLEELRQVRIWGSLHHERLDGTGYPFHYKSQAIPLGSRIMSVADVFVALAENRPYRPGVKQSEVMSILERMANNAALDASVVSLLAARFDEIDHARINAQTQATQEYQAFVQATGDSL